MAAFAPAAPPPAAAPPAPPAAAPAPTPEANPQAEAIVAVIGIEPFLAHSLRQVTKAHYKAAGGIPERIDREIYRFINRDDREPPSELPPFDFDAVAELVTRAPTAEDIEATIAAFGPNDELALAVGGVVTRLKDQLSQRLPRAVRDTLAGPVSSRPPGSDIARFRRAWNVANDPLHLLAELQEFALSRDQAQALVDFYPTVAAHLGPSVQTQLARKMAVQQGYELPRLKDLLLRILTQQEDAMLVLGKAMQAIYAEEAQARQANAARVASRRGVSASTESTAAQRVDQA